LLHSMTVPQLDMLVPDPPTRDKPVDNLIVRYEDMHTQQLIQLMPSPLDVGIS
jgi:hypothetical protein